MYTSYNVFLSLFSSISLGHAHLAVTNLSWRCPILLPLQPNRRLSQTSPYRYVYIYVNMQIHTRHPEDTTRNAVSDDEKLFAYDRIAFPREGCPSWNVGKFHGPMLYAT